MLDAGQDAPARDALAQQARAQIEGGGTLKHENNWGLRRLAYEIAQRSEADYRWFRFEAAPELLEEIDHSLKITDGVLRFRIWEDDPEAPVLVPPATAAPGPGPPASARPGRRGRRLRRRLPPSPLRSRLRSRRGSGPGPRGAGPRTRRRCDSRARPLSPQQMRQRSPSPPGRQAGSRGTGRARRVGLPALCDYSRPSGGRARRRRS